MNLDAVEVGQAKRAYSPELERHEVTVVRVTATRVTVAFADGNTKQFLRRSGCEVGAASLPAYRKPWRLK